MKAESRPRIRRKIAILFPAFLGGGAESVALAMIAGLKDTFDVTLVTFSRLDVDSLNANYGTSLSPEYFITEIPYERTPLPQLLTSHFSFFTARQHLLLRHFKRIRHRFDLAIGAFNEMDLGGPGIQYLHSPMFGKGHEKGRALLGYPDSPTRRIYHRLFERLSDFSEARMKSNLSVGNSQWTAALFHRLYDIDVRVLYPPVAIDVPRLAWDDREDGFVCVSRIVAEKRVEDAIDIIDQLRQRGFDTHLHLISSASEPAYREKIGRIQRERSGWVFLNENLSRAQLAEALSQHRYGIHVRVNEQFGISVAEMVQAGCITFVPKQGGPAEIVGGAEALMFENKQEAVEKICSALSDAQEQKALLARLQTRRDAFTPQHFREELLKLVTQALAEYGGDDASRAMDFKAPRPSSA